MDQLEVSSRVNIPVSEFDFNYSRSSGPGGQNVNKVNSKVIMYWSINESSAVPGDVRERFVQKFAHRLSTDGVVIINSDRFRDQKRNVQDCMDKLREMLTEVLTAPKKRRPTKPTKGSVERRIQQKKVVKDRKAGRKKVDW